MLRFFKTVGKIVLAIVVLVALFFILRDHNPAEGQTTAQTFLFTWSGDDGNVGTCAGLDFRWRQTPIVGTDTLTWWNGATKFTGVYPTPKVSGTPDSINVTSVPNGTQIYAIVKAFDEALNLSGYSNVAAVVTKDFVQPGRITDLRAAQVEHPRPRFAFASRDATGRYLTAPSSIMDLRPPGAPVGPPAAPGLTT